MLATDVINIVESSGISELARMYQLSRRQAESFELQARRLLATGVNPVVVPGSDAGTVRASHGPGTGTLEEPSGTDEAEELERTAQSRASAIKREVPGHRARITGELQGRLRVLERNRQKGFSEWDYDERLTRRILELVEGAHV
jgi:hypothetical protein